MDPRYLRGVIAAVILAVIAYGLLPARPVFSNKAELLFEVH